MQNLKTLAVLLFNVCANTLLFLFGFVGLIMAPNWGTPHIFTSAFHLGGVIFSSAAWIFLLNAYLGVGRRFDKQFKQSLTTDAEIGKKIISPLPSRLLIHLSSYRASFYATALVIGKRWKRSPTIAALFEGYDFQRDATWLDWLLACSFFIPFGGLLLAGISILIQSLK